MVGKHGHRSNVPVASLLGSYRRMMYVPCSDSMTTQLEIKFAGENRSANHVTIVVSALMLDRSVDDVKPTLELYAEFIESQNLIIDKHELGKQKWLSVWTSSILTSISFTTIDALTTASAYGSFFSLEKNFLEIHYVHREIEGVVSAVRASPPYHLS